MAMDLDSSKDDVFHGNIRCYFGNEATTAPSVTPGASPLHHSVMEDGDGSSHQSLTSLCVICMSVRHSCHLGSCRGDTHSVFSDPSAMLSVPWSIESMNSLGNPPFLVPTPPKEKKVKEPTSRSMPSGPTIRRLIKETGKKHVYFGQGAPITNNPGNKRFRRIVDRYHLEYKGTSSHTAKRAIKNKILREVKKNGSRFFCFGVDMAGNFKPELVKNKEVSGKTGHALRDAWKYRANWWSWADLTQERLSWSDFSNKDGTALEKMFQEELHRREEVPVSIRKEKHLVDVSSMMMHRVDATGNSIYCLRVRRLEPKKGIDGEEQIFVSDGSDGQDDASSSTQSSGSQNSEASGTTIRSSVHRAGGAGGVQGNQCCSLGKAEQFTDESLVFAFEALDEDVLQQITAVLEEERADEVRSSVPPVSHPERDTRAANPPFGPTDSGTAGEPAPGLAKRLISTLSFGKKKNDPTEKKQQDMGIPTQHEAIWLWRESKTRMSRHSSDAIFGDPKECWVRYDEESSALLEASYNAQNALGECSPNSKYTVDFGLMLQINVSTRFPREVQRLQPTTIIKAPKREDGPLSKLSSSEIERKLGNIRVHEVADDMTAPTITAETLMGL